MAGLVVAAIVVLAECELERLHRARQRVRAGLQQQMDVIVHEHIGIESTAVADAIAFQPVQIGGRIGVVMDDHRPAIAAGNHMVQGPRKIDSRFARHGEGAYRSRLNKSIRMPDPTTPFTLRHET